MRRALVPLALLASTGLASAAPQGRVCLRRAAFAGLVASGPDALLVDDGRYVSLAGTTPTVVEKPAKVAPDAVIPDAIVHRGKSVRACYRRTCRTLGPTVAALFPPTAAPTDTIVGGVVGDAAGSSGAVTSDLQLLVYNGSSVYSIAKDAKLELAPPPGSAQSSSILVEPYGKVLLAFFGPQAAVYTGKGLVGTSFPAGARVELSPTLLAVAQERVTIVDTKTGAQLGSVELSSTPVAQRRAVRLGADRLAVAFEIDGAWTVAWISVSAKGVPTISRRVTLPICP